MGGCRDHVPGRDRGGAGRLVGFAVFRGTSDTVGLCSRDVCVHGGHDDRRRSDDLWVYKAMLASFLGEVVSSQGLGEETRERTCPA